MIVKIREIAQFTRATPGSSLVFIYRYPVVKIPSEIVSASTLDSHLPRAEESF